MTISIAQRQTGSGSLEANASVSITTASGSLVVLLATAVALTGGPPAISLVAPAAGPTEAFNVTGTAGQDHAVACWAWRTDATTYNIEVAGGSHTYLVIHALEITSSEGAALDIFDYAINDTSSSTCTYLSVDTNMPNALVLAQGWIDYVSGIALPSGYTQEYSTGFGGTSGWVNLLGSRTYASAGATGDQTDAMNTAQYITAHLAIGNLAQHGFFNFENF